MFFFTLVKITIIPTTILGATCFYFFQIFQASNKQIQSNLPCKPTREAFLFHPIAVNGHSARLPSDPPDFTRDPPEVPLGRGRYFAKCAKNVSWEKKKTQMEGRKIRRYTYGSQIIGENRVFHIEHGIE